MTLKVHSRTVSVMIFYCVALHLCWAAIILCDPNALGATPVNALYGVFRSVPGIVTALVVAALMAAVSPLTRAPWSISLLIPQQTLLWISACGAGAAVIASHFADGVVRPRAFIGADQMHIALAAIGHAVAIVMHARDR